MGLCVVLALAVQTQSDEILDVARRLAADLRDGLASDSAPALLEALEGRPEALAPLQAAFRDPATSAAGRVELAGALAELDDAVSWRDGLVAIMIDEEAQLDDRIGAAEQLLAVGDARAGGGDEPRATLISDAAPAEAPAPRRAHQKTTTEADSFRMKTPLIAVAVAACLLIALLALKRKG